MAKWNHASVMVIVVVMVGDTPPDPGSTPPQTRAWPKHISQQIFVVDAPHAPRCQNSALLKPFHQKVSQRKHVYVRNGTSKPHQPTFVSFSRTAQVTIKCDHSNTGELVVIGQEDKKFDIYVSIFVKEKL